jgi:hypothetical protein
MVSFINSSSHYLGLQIKLEFVLTQHFRDEQLMLNLREYLDCGNLYKYKQIVKFKITKFDCASYMNEKVISFFQKHPLHGVKLLDFLDFVKVMELMKKKEHLTASGLVLLRIRKIKAPNEQRKKILLVSHLNKVSLFICRISLIALIISIYIYFLTS